MSDREQSCWQAGFALIELVAVIVILGIVAAVAIARFVDLRTDAYKAAFGSTVGAYTTAVNFSQQLCVVRCWAGRDNLPGRYGVELYGDDKLIDDLRLQGDCFRRQLQVYV